MPKPTKRSTNARRQILPIRKALFYRLQIARSSKALRRPLRARKHARRSRDTDPPCVQFSAPSGETCRDSPSGPVCAVGSRSVGARIAGADFSGLMLPVRSADGLCCICSVSAVRSLSTLSPQISTALQTTKARKSPPSNTASIRMPRRPCLASLAEKTSLSASCVAETGSPRSSRSFTIAPSPLVTSRENGEGIAMFLQCAAAANLVFSGLDRVAISRPGCRRRYGE
jgi:hypothetical protein